MNIISIRLSSNGDLFVMPDISQPESQAEQGSRVVIEIVTKRAMLIPHALFEESGDDDMLCAAAALEEASIGYNEDEEIVIIPGEQGDVDALVVIPKELKREIERRYKECDYTITTPLLRKAFSLDEHIVLDEYEGITTLKLYGKGGELRFADLYDTPTETMTLYWATKMLDLLISKESPLYIYRCSDIARVELQEYFQNVVLCE